MFISKDRTYWEPDTSVPIRRISYDPVQGIATVEFLGGTVHGYWCVQDLWNDWLNADSAGRFFVKYIKPEEVK